ncbi:MAG: hypothetical protein ACTSWN_08835 [Promethearchaeota archaeon]
MSSSNVSSLSSGLPSSPAGGGLPGLSTSQDSSSGGAGDSISMVYDDDSVYELVSRLEEFLQRNKSKSFKPFELSRTLGFTDPEDFYKFVINLKRDDLIRFDGGKIIINVHMSPIDTNFFIQKYEKWLKEGHL